MRKFQVVSKEYYSNCMVEAIKAKMRNPQIKLYFCKPRMTENRNFQMFHFMWSDGKADYDFSDLKENELPPYRNLIFKGVIRKFDLGFAERYSIYRNAKSRKDTKSMMKKEWIRRAARTFGQAAIGVIVADLAAGVDITDLKGVLTLVVGPAIAAGLAAVMNMDKKKESEVE